MHFSDAFQSSLQSIFNHKMRSSLTLVGIVIGVLAVVTMFSSVFALKAFIQKNMESMGWNHSIIVTQGTPSKQTIKRLLWYRQPAKVIRQLNYDDFSALQTETKHKIIYGMIETSSIYKIRNKSISVRIRATNPAFFTNKNYPLRLGRYYNDYEDRLGLPVIVLGYYFANQQFGDEDPIGKMITLGSQRYKIVGVLNSDQLNSKKGMNFNTWERQEDLKCVYVPLKYGAQYFMPNMGVHYIYLQAFGESDFDLLKHHVRQILLTRHQMYQNFTFQDIGAFLLQINKEIDSSMKKWNITLSAIASISLIVGGIGLFSTLLISIQERMTEIGVRKSIGATDKDIFYYFILEAITLAMLGALIGIMLSWFTVLGMSKAMGITMYLPIQGVVLGLSFSFIIGFVSGLYPAIKASNIDPIQAIFYFE